MATKTIDHMHFYVAISPYQRDSSDQTFNSLRVSVGYRKGRGFYAAFQPGWGEGGLWGCVFDGSSNPLTAGDSVSVEPAVKNSSKRIQEMHAALGMAKDVIAALFDDREWVKLKSVLQNAARYGYTEKFRQQGEAYLSARKAKSESDNNSINDSNNSTIMANNLQAADLIGKKILVGDGKSYYVAKSIDGDKVVLDLHRGEAAPMELPMKFDVLKGMIDKGTLTIEGDAPAATDEVEVAEVVDIVPVKPTVKPKAEGKAEPKSEKPKAEKKPKPAPKAKEEKPKAEVKADGKLTYSTYTSKKGKTCARISGFGENDPAYVNAQELHGSASWDKVNGSKVLYLAFGHRYVDAAKQVCDALNAGKTFGDCKAIVDGATAERAQKREEYKAKREERKAAAEPEDDKERETYELFKRFIAGDKDAAAIVEELAKKAA